MCRRSGEIAKGRKTTHEGRGASRRRLPAEVSISPPPRPTRGSPSPTVLALEKKNNSREPRISFQDRRALSRAKAARGNELGLTSIRRFPPPFPQIGFDPETALGTTRFGTLVGVERIARVRTKMGVAVPGRDRAEAGVTVRETAAASDLGA